MVSPLSPKSEVFHSLILLPDAYSPECRGMLGQEDWWPCLSVLAGRGSSYGVPSRRSSPCSLQPPSWLLLLFIWLWPSFTLEELGFQLSLGLSVFADFLALLSPACSAGPAKTLSPLYFPSPKRPLPHGFMVDENQFDRMSLV